MTPEPERPLSVEAIGSPPSAGRDESVEDLLENAPCGYIVARPDRHIIRVNATLVNWLGYQRNALADKPFTDLLAAG